MASVLASVVVSKASISRVRSVAAKWKKNAGEVPTTYFATSAKPCVLSASAGSRPKTSKLTPCSASFSNSTLNTWASMST